MTVIRRDESEQKPQTLEEAAKAIEAGCDWMARALGRAEAERDLAYLQLEGAVEALEQIKRIAAIEAPPVSDEVPAKVWKVAFDALNALRGR